MENRGGVCGLSKGANGWCCRSSVRLSGVSVKLRIRAVGLSSPICSFSFQQREVRGADLDESGSVFLKPFTPRSAGLRFMNVAIREKRGAAKTIKKKYHVCGFSKLVINSKVQESPRNVETLA